jgi:hypothetical protein
VVRFVIRVRTVMKRVLVIQVLLFTEVERSFLEGEAAAVVVGHIGRWKEGGWWLIKSWKRSREMSLVGDGTLLQSQGMMGKSFSHC